MNIYKTKLSKLNYRIQRRIKNELYKNGWSETEFRTIWNQSTLEDVRDVIDVESVIENEY